MGIIIKKLNSTKMATQKNIKGRIEEHWLFAVWVILLTAIPYIAFGKYMDQASIVAKILAFVNIGAMIFIVYKHDPNLDKYKWAVAIAAVVFAVWIMLPVSDFKANL